MCTYVVYIEIIDVEADDTITYRHFDIDTISRLLPPPVTVCGAAVADRHC